MPANCGPLRVAKHYDRNPAAFQILLVTDVFIGGEQNIKSSFFRRLQQGGVTLALALVRNLRTCSTVQREKAHCEQEAVTSGVL
jgi:hypothetical protein